MGLLRSDRRRAEGRTTQGLYVGPIRAQSSYKNQTTRTQLKSSSKKKFRGNFGLEFFIPIVRLYSTCKINNSSFLNACSLRHNVCYSLGNIFLEKCFFLKNFSSDSHFTQQLKTLRIRFSWCFIKLYWCLQVTKMQNP